MSFLKETEEKFALENLNLYREFDSKSFIGIANSSLSNNDDIVDAISSKLNFYIDFLKKSVESINNVYIDRKALASFMSDAALIVDKRGFTMRDITYSDVYFVDGYYIKECWESIKNEIKDVMASESFDKSRLNPYLSGNVTKMVKRNSVKTTFTKDLSIKDLVSSSDYVRVDVDSNYIKSKVIPFVNFYNKTKEKTVETGTNLINTLNDVNTDITLFLNNIRGQISGESFKGSVDAVNQTIYVTSRALLDIVSYVSYMDIRMNNTLMDNVFACNKLYKYISDSIYDKSMTESSMDDVTGVASDDASVMAREFMEAGVPAFKIYADRIIEFFEGYKVSANLIDKPDSIKGIGDTKSYSMYPYQETARMFLNIEQRLDNMASKSDDYIMIFDKLINNSGFLLPLMQEYGQKLDYIEDTTNYSDIDAMNSMLGEIKDYGFNMEKLAQLAQADTNRISNLMKRFSNEIIGEYNNSVAASQIRTWLEEFKEDFTKLNVKVVSGYMKRLRDMDAKLKAFIGGCTVPIIENEDLDDFDYSLLAFESVYDDYEEFNRFVSQTLEKEFYIAREKELKGMDLVFEADAPAPGTVQNNNSQANVGTNVNTNTTQNKQQNNTSPVVNDNSGISNSSGGLINNLKSSIENWFNDMMNKFMQMTDKLKNSSNVRDIIDNRDALLNRSYSNVSIEILPYNNMKSETIISDMGKLASNIRGINPQVIQNINEKNDLYAKLIPFIIGLNPDQDVKTQITNYYKTKSLDQTKTITFSNNELKTFVQSDMVPFATTYYDNIRNSVQQNVNNIRDSLTATTQSYNTVQESTSTMLEANDPNANTTVSMSQKAAWMSEIVKSYCGCVVMSLRDRNNDYIKVLHQLIPKNQNQNNQQPQNNPQPNVQNENPQAPVQQ